MSEDLLSAQAHLPRIRPHATRMVPQKKAQAVLVEQPNSDLPPQGSGLLFRPWVIQRKQLA